MELSEEHEALRESVEDFAQKEVAPVIADYYIREKFPYGLVATMGEMGLFGLPIEETYGGMGGDYTALCVALEELGRVDQSVAITPARRSKRRRRSRSWSRRTRRWTTPATPPKSSVATAS